MKTTVMVALVATVSLLAPIAAGQARFSTAYTFTNGNPWGIRYANGVFYGATYAHGLAGNCGTVFELQPPAGPGCAWAEIALYSFSNANGDACDPTEAPVVAPSGALYGVTGGGGAYSGGAAYELHPPASPGGAWTETMIYSFNIQIGLGPITGQPTSLILGPNGSLYVTTDDGGSYLRGSLVQLQPPSSPGGTWTGTTLYSFTGGAGGNLPTSLTPGPNGVLYGTTQLDGTFRPDPSGTVFELFPPATPGGAWTGTVRYSFQGHTDGSTPNSLILGPRGSLYGATFGTLPYGPSGTGVGTVFQLLPPASPGASWTKITLQQFGHGNYCGPDAPLMLRNGNLYGASCAAQTGNGVVFEMQPPATPGGAWTTTYLHRFTDGQIPGGAMAMTRDGAIYGVTVNPCRSRRAARFARSRRNRPGDRLRRS